MTNDLVKRLRIGQNAGSRICGQAANEIERLQHYSDLYRQMRDELDHSSDLLREKVANIRNEFRVKSVCEDRSGVYYQLQVLTADKTPDGLVIVVRASE